MELNTTIRSFNGSIYVRFPPALVEYYNLKELIARADEKKIEPTCKIEDKDKNHVSVTLPKW